MQKESCSTVLQQYENGDSYRGQLKMGMRNGHGVYTYKNGSRYEGDFVNGALSGTGIFYYKNGEMYKGEW